MQRTNSLYKQILANPSHKKIVKVDIAGTTYVEEGELFSCIPSFNLFSKNALGVGGVCSSKLELEILPKGTIPKMALIEPYVAVTDGTQTSDYLPYGKFYIYHRDIDEETGHMIITAFDAMIKAEQTAYTSVPASLAMDDIVDDFCTRMGVTLDSGTIVSHTMTCGFDSTLTMREYLGYIAVAHAGNWTITEEGKLKLVDAFVTDSLLINEDGKVILFGGVGIYV